MSSATCIECGIVSERVAHICTACLFPPRGVEQENDQAREFPSLELALARRTLIEQIEDRNLSSGGFWRNWNSRDRITGSDFG